MNAHRIFAMLFLSLLCLAGPVQSQFYYNGNTRVPLTIDPSKITIKFDSAQLVPTTGTDLAEVYDKLGTVVDDKHTLHGFVVCEVDGATDYRVMADTLSKLDLIKRVEPYYLYQNSIPILMGESIVVQFSEDVSMEQIDSINGIYGVEICGGSEVRHNALYLRVTERTELDLLNLANRYHELSETEYALPNLRVGATQDAYRLFDYYNGYQWHLKKVARYGDSVSVWDFHGLTDSIIVAVVDDGIRPHPDLPASRVLFGKDFTADGDFHPEPGPINSHGMACAGLIAASHSTDSLQGDSTTSGIISMDPYVLIRPVKVFYDSTSEVCGPPPDSVFALGIDWAWSTGEAAVLSCSWHLAVPDSDVTAAIHNAYTGGRRGKGSPVIFSSGNSPYGAGGAPVSFPARLPDVLAIGAIDSLDSRYAYSNMDSTLDLVAPSGPWPKGSILGGDVWTLDQAEWGKGWNPEYIYDCPSLGNNDDDYTCGFTGTSAAAPLVSGTAALIISFDSMLTAPEVYEILRQSAVTELKSDTITPPDTAYGYGRVDAYRAILSLARGDMNADGKINLADISLLIGYVYQGGPGGFPDVRLGNCDCDAQGNINLADITLLMDHVYGSKAPLPVPCFVY